MTEKDRFIIMACKAIMSAQGAISEIMQEGEEVQMEDLQEANSLLDTAFELITDCADDLDIVSKKI